jgi:hypothetical protein
MPQPQSLCGVQCVSAVCEYSVGYSVWVECVGAVCECSVGYSVWVQCVGAVCGVQCVGAVCGVQCVSAVCECSVWGAVCGCSVWVQCVGTVCEYNLWVQCLSTVFAPSVHASSHLLLTLFLSKLTVPQHQHTHNLSSPLVVQLVASSRVGW